MTLSQPLLTHENVAEFWRRRFRRQKHVNAGVRSLLHKYGSATSSRTVATDLLLTLMGNLITAEACFYRMAGDERTLSPEVSFGAIPLETLPIILADSAFVKTVHEAGAPRLLNSLPRTTTDDDSLSRVCGQFKLFAPLLHEQRLQGIVFLGAKVTNASYNDNDMELLEALCAVTATVLHHLEFRRLAGTPEKQAAQVLVRCQELAGGVADHLERSLRAIGQAITATGDGDGARMAHVEEAISSLHYLVPSLRVIANDPASLEARPGEAYDPVEALHAAVFSMRARADTRQYTLTLRHDLAAMRGAVPINRATVVDAVRTTLRLALEQCESTCRLLVHIDRTDALPSAIGETAPGSARDAGVNVRAADSMLRVRIEASDSANAEGPKQGTMKILADNLEAFQTLREMAPSQQSVVNHGGSVVWRKEPGLAVWLIYLPLRSV